jgi:hypothetical protein
MPGVLLSVLLPVLLGLGILSGPGQAPEVADPLRRTPVALVSVVLPASVNAVRPDVQLAADRRTDDGVAVWLFVAVVCALLARSARRVAWAGSGASRSAAPSLIVLGALRGRAPPHTVR